MKTNFAFIFQLDTFIWGRQKKSGRGAGVRSGTGFNTMPRPNSGDDFDEIEQQKSRIERMDEETMNDQFEKMLVNLFLFLSKLIFIYENYHYFLSLQLKY